MNLSERKKFKRKKINLSERKKFKRKKEDFYSFAGKVNLSYLFVQATIPILELSALETKGFWMLN